MVRKAIESLYKGSCDIIEYDDVFDKRTKITDKAEAVVLTNQPCRLSFRIIKNAVESDVQTGVSQLAKLFISPDINIKPGSKIIVTQNGVTTEYAFSGKPAVYSGHQEIMLDLFKGWA